MHIEAALGLGLESCLRCLYCDVAGKERTCAFIHLMCALCSGKVG